MRIKSYFANRVEVAVERAQLELGEDAVLLNTRHTEGEAREFGKYEVIFGTNAPMDALEGGSEIGESPEDEFLKRELAAIGDTTPVWAGTKPVATPFKQAPPQPSNPLGAPGVIVFVGPAGAGKTASLMKLAFILSAVRGDQTRVVQLDRERVAAGEPWRTFGEILDIPVLWRDSIRPDDLHPASQSEYVLVDTPGFAPADGRAPEQLAEFLRTIPNRRTHLVLPAWWSLTELSAVVRRFAPLSPEHLLITRADEVSSDSTVQSLAAACELPISLISASRHASAGFANTPFLTWPSRIETAA